MSTASSQPSVCSEPLLFSFNDLGSRQVIADFSAGCVEAQKLANEIADEIQKSDRNELIISIQGNLAYALLFQGHYDEALAINRQNWDKPFNGKTFGEVTLEDFAAFVFPLKLLLKINDALPYTDLVLRQVLSANITRMGNAAPTWIATRPFNAHTRRA
jgi:hypothetical protein